MTKYKYVLYGDQRWWFIDDWFFLYYESASDLHAIHAIPTGKYPLAATEDLRKLIRTIWAVENIEVDK
jgi:hypothetical protein